MRNIVHTAVFQRHSETDEAARDFDRQLTALGWVKANAMAEKLMEISFDFCLASPAPRVLQTVGAVQTRRQSGKNFPVHTIEELYFPVEGSEGRVALEAMFSRLKYAPLAEYMKQPEYGSILPHGDLAIERVFEFISQFDPKDEKDLNLLLSGHAVTINLLLHEFVSMYLTDKESLAQVRSMATEIVLGPAECFVLKLDPIGDCLISIEHLKPELAAVAA